MKILITGGAGFIGSHIADGLISKGHEVRILDSLDPQVHGQNPDWPEYLDPNIEKVRGSILDPKIVSKALENIDAVYHEAAAVGVGQSMYEIRHYTETNALGTAVLLEAVVSKKDDIKKMIVASSMSIYGEGKYSCPACGPAFPSLRPEIQLKGQKWELECPSCAKQLAPIPTDEGKPLQPTSIYAINKRDHEEMFLSVGTAYKIPAVALRYFNVYGTRQALSNPYTGVAAIFSSRLLNKKSPLIYEDGMQSRDFVHISDIVQANLLALEKPEADGQVFNVGTGKPQTIRGVAELLAQTMETELQPEITQKFRAGDVRHCYADISKISKVLGYAPKISFDHGVEELITWVKKQTAADRMHEAVTELKKRGLA